MPEPAVEIVIDFEQWVLIDQVKVYSVGGGLSDVEFPEFIAVLVSNDGKTYGFAGLISSEDLANLRSVGHNRVPHTFIIGNLNTQGRFVKIVVRPNRRYFFLDEIEIIGNKSKLGGQTGRREDLPQFTDSSKVLRAIEDYQQLRVNIVETIKALQDGGNRFPVDFVKKVLPELESIAKEGKLPTDKIYSQNELSVLRMRLGMLRAQIYRKVYNSELACFATNPMEAVFEKDMCFQENLKEINVQLWQNEYESAAFNIVNCSDEPMRVSVSISPLAGGGGEQVDSDKTVTVRRTIYVQGATVGSIADALVLQKDRPFVLQPGELTQIWLTVFNPMLTAGVYKGQIGISARTVTGKDLPIETIAVSVDVQKNKFPESIALNTWNWAYYRVGSVSETVEDLRSHYINICTPHSADIPFPGHTSDSTGIIRKSDLEKFDKILREHNYARMYQFFLHFTSDEKDYGRFGQWMTPHWKASFSSWLKEFVKHLNDIGADYDEWALHPFDETLCDEYFELAKLVKSIDPKIRLYANSFGEGPKQFMRFKELIDIWCPEDKQCEQHLQWLELIKSFGQEVWTYECLGPAKAHNPYSYYRLMPWRAFKRGQTGAGFWVYHDGLNHQGGAISWDDTLRPYYRNYGVIYGAGTSPVDTHGEQIIPSRRWEAWREGVEDYEYLWQLQKAIDKLKGKEPQKADQAQKILNNELERVLKNPTNCEVIYQARRNITYGLSQLLIGEN